MGPTLGAWDAATPPTSPTPDAQSRAQSPDYWSQHSDLDELTTVEQNELVQTYTPAPCAAPRAAAGQLPGGATLPPLASEAAIVISSLATGRPKPGAHFTEHDKRRKEYLARRLTRQLRVAARPAAEAGVMEVAHGPGTVIARGVPDLRVPFGYYYDRDGRGRKGIEPPSPAKKPPADPPFASFGATISPQQSQSLASFMLTTQASHAPESLEASRVQRHHFSVSPCVSISQNLTEGYGPSPSALACDSTLRGSQASFSLHSNVLKPRLRPRAVRPSAFGPQGRRGY